MRIRVRYFASVRDSAGRSEDELDLPCAATTLSELRTYLNERPDGVQLSQCKNVRAAVNYTMIRDDTVVADGDEVAFFPPVTGG